MSCLEVTLKLIPGEFGGNVVIRANDIDILIIAATNMRHLVRNNLWMDIGHDSDNSNALLI